MNNTIGTRKNLGTFGGWDRSRWSRWWKTWPRWSWTLRRMPPPPRESWDSRHDYFFVGGGSRESSGVCRILGVKQDKTRSSLVEVGISPWFVFFFPGGIIELEFHDDFMMDDHITVVLINCRRTQRSSLQMVNCMISITNGSVTDGAEPPKQIENSRPVI